MAGLPIQAGGGHMAGPVLRLLDRKIRSQGKVVLLDQDNVPDLQNR